MRGRFAILTAAACLTGCGDAGSASRLSDAVVRREMPGVRADEPIVGRWIVTALGDEVQQPGATPITVEIDADFIRAQSQCVPFPFIYKRDGAGILLGKINPGGVCARGLSHWEQEFDIAMYNADRVRRTAEGGLEFSGPGRTVRMRAVENGR